MVISKFDTETTIYNIFAYYFFSYYICNMKHTILIDYTTGDSFGHERSEQPLELEWDNLDIAKENLQRIKEHYHFVSALDSYELRYSKEKTELLIEENKNKPWFVLVLKPSIKSGEHDMIVSEKEVEKYRKAGVDVKYIAEPFRFKSGINLKADNGNTMQMSCFWIGYFESLHGARIVSGDSDMQFTI
jgi:hypothetical protein